MRHRHRGIPASLEAKYRDRRVLHVAFEGDRAHHACDIAYRPAQVEQHLDAMTAEVEHGSSPRLLPAHQPVPRMIRCRVEVFERIYLRHHQRADLAGVQDVLDPRDNGIEPAIVCHAERDVVRPACRDHGVALATVHRHGLLAEHMLARFRGGDRLRCVQAHGRGDVHGIDVRIREQLRRGGIPARCTELSCERFSEFRPTAADRHQPARRQVAQRRGHTLPGNVARPDQPPP